MQNSPCIHGGKFIKLPFMEMKPVFQVVIEQAFGSGLHPADPACDPVPVNCMCRFGRQKFRPIAAQRRFFEHPDISFHFRIGRHFRTCIKAVSQPEIPGRLFTFSDTALDKAPQKVCQDRPPCFFVPDLFLYRSLLRYLDLQVRKQISEHVHQIRGSHAFLILRYPGKRNRQCLGRLCHIEIEIEPLDEHLLPGGRRKDSSQGSQKFPVHVRENTAF